MESRRPTEKTVRQWELNLQKFSEKTPDSPWILMLIEEMPPPDLRRYPSIIGAGSDSVIREHVLVPVVAKLVRMMSTDTSEFMRSYDEVAKEAVMQFNAWRAIDMENGCRDAPISVYVPFQYDAGVYGDNDEIRERIQMSEELEDLKKSADPFDPGTQMRIQDIEMTMQSRFSFFITMERIPSLQVPGMLENWPHVQFHLTPYDVESAILAVHATDAVGVDNPPRGYMMNLRSDGKPGSNPGLEEVLKRLKEYGIASPNYTTGTVCGAIGSAFAALHYWGDYGNDHDSIGWNTGFDVEFLLSRPRMPNQSFSAYIHTRESDNRQRVLSSVRDLAVWVVDYGRCDPYARNANEKADKSLFVYSVQRISGLLGVLKHTWQDNISQYVPRCQQAIEWLHFFNNYTRTAVLALTQPRDDLPPDGSNEAIQLCVTAFDRCPVLEQVLKHAVNCFMRQVGITFLKFLDMARTKHTVRSLAAMVQTPYDSGYTARLDAFCCIGESQEQSGKIMAIAHMQTIRSLVEMVIGPPMSRSAIVELENVLINANPKLAGLIGRQFNVRVIDLQKSLNDVFAVMMQYITTGDWGQLAYVEHDIAQLEI
jgi:hypothetical protein